MQDHFLKLRPRLFSVIICFLASVLVNHELQAAGDVLLAMRPESLEVLEQSWTVTAPKPARNAPAPKFHLVNDEILEREVLETSDRWHFESKQELTGDYLIEGLVLFTDKVEFKDARRVRFHLEIACGQRQVEDQPFPAYIFNVKTFASLFSGSARAGTTPPVRGAKQQTDEAGRAWGGSLSLKPGIAAANISPILPENMRLEMEAAVAAMPADASERWHRLRIEIGSKRIRMFVNGAMICDAAPLEDAAAAGTLKVTLNGNARMAELTVRPLPETAAGYTTVPLDYRCNRQTDIRLTGLNLAQTGETAVSGVPFLLPRNIDGRNQLDVSASLFRHRLGTSYTADYDPRATVPGPDVFDPHRLTVRVPYRAWRRAWILAAAEPASPERVPLVTLRFYRPYTGWSIDSAVEVPTIDFTGDAGKAVPVTAKDKNGADIKLWLVPVELDTAALAADFPMQAIEITKEVLPNRGYPDPNNYGYMHGGIPSSVQLFGLTLEEAPLHAVGSGSNNGNVFTRPAQPDWQVTVRNQTDTARQAEIKIDVTGPYGEKWQESRQIRLAPAGTEVVSFKPKADVLGLYQVQTAVASGDWTQVRNGSFLVLPENDRQETSVSSPWGLWCWFGTHDTNPDLEDNARLLKAVGAVNTSIFSRRERVDGALVNRDDFYEWRLERGLGAPHYRAIPRRVPAWTNEDPVNQEKFAQYAEEIGKTVAELKQKNPDLLYANAFAENSISLRLTHGVPPWAFGNPWFEYTEAEQQRLHSLWTAAKAAAEGIAAQAPEVKFLLGHCAPNFFTPFFMLDDWDQYKDKIAGFGLDMPQFERMPERPPRATEPTLLYFLKQEMEKRGLQDKMLVHLESYFSSSHELALGWQGQAENMIRTAVLSLALGTTKFKDSWSLHDAGGRWGSQHYGCVGIISRQPEYNPKPAAAAFATMTRVLDLCRYDSWLATGSKSTFCLQFKGPGRLVYPAWSVRGKRNLELVPESAAVTLSTVDYHGNERPLPPNGTGLATVELSQDVIWIIARNGGLKEVRAWPPGHTAPARPHRHRLEDFSGKPWQQQQAANETFAGNHWDVVRRQAPMTVQQAPDTEGGGYVMKVSLETAPANQPLTGFYTTIVPPAPILIPGKAATLGFQAWGDSSWHRIIFELEDAKGERWFNYGTKDVFNSDDINSLTYVNHDGWRYMETPLPANAPGDNYREISTLSWGHDQEGIVDLPLKITGIIVVMRPQMIYVNELLPVDSLTVKFTDISAVYNNPEDMTSQPVLVQQAAAGAVQLTGAPNLLPNPIAQLTEAGTGKPAVIEKIYPPEVMQAGDSIYVRVQPVPDAKAYKVYVSAYPDGTGAMAMGKQDKEPNIIYIRRLQPAIPIYLFATWIDQDDKESKPSAVRETVLKDEFPFK